MLSKQSCKNASGMAVFVTWQNFGNIEDQLEATAEDSALLAATLRPLGFKIHRLNDLQPEQLQQRLRLLCDRTRWNEVSCLILAVSSHGDSRSRVYMGQHVRQLAEIWTPFINIPALKPKLKLFIFDMCRGRRVDVLQPRMSAQLQQKYENFPNTSNCIIVASSAETFQSFASADGPSFLTSVLCETLKKDPSRELTSLLTDVSRTLLGNFQSKDSRRRLISQTTSVTSSMTGPAHLLKSCKKVSSESLFYSWEPHRVRCFIFTRPNLNSLATLITSSCRALGLSPRVLQLNSTNQYLQELGKVGRGRSMLSGLVVFVIGLENEDKIHESRTVKLQRLLGECPNLLGAPKVFFFIHMDVDREKSSDLVNLQEEISENYVSQNSDFMFACGHGEHYLRSLAEELKSDDTELTRVLTRVHNHVASSSSNHNMAPHYQSTLLKAIKF